jgi:hypothetical protein
MAKANLSARPAAEGDPEVVGRHGVATGKPIMVMAKRSGPA